MDKKKIEFLALGFFILMAVVFVINILIARYERHGDLSVKAGYDIRKPLVKEVAAPVKKNKPAVMEEEPDTNVNAQPGGGLLQ